MEESQIQKFYKATNVFLTGGTGFLGKALIENLLRNTEVETIYILIREKKGQSSHTRIDSLFDDVIFNRLKAEKPKCRNRVEAIPGDVSIAGLGLSISDRERLISNIDIVLHVAATVNFNEQIKLAYSINVNGTRDIVNLAREMKKLKSILHISTAFSNCNRKEIDEIIYDHPMKCTDLEAVLEKMTSSESNLCTEKLLGDWPNTYTYTKALAESLIKETGNGLPIGIFRPAIVISTAQDPFPGWIDNLYGPTGTAVGTMSGILRVAMCSPEKLADMVPADKAVAGVIAAAWDVSQQKNENTEIPIYNYVASPENPIIWDEFIKLNFIHGMDYMPSNALWRPWSITTTNPYIYFVLKFLLHILPAIMIDSWSLVTGGKPRLFHLYKKIHKFNQVLEYFSTREWKFSNKNVQALWRRMSKTDQELFPLSMTTVSWLLFFRNYLKGVRQYILKEDESTLERSKQRLRRFFILHAVFKVLVIYLTCSLVRSIIVNIYSSIFS